MLRLTLKGTFSRWRRLVLSGLAVVLGVMFVSGALVLTATLGGSYTDVARRAHAGTDVSVSPAEAISAAGVPAALVDRLAHVDGVAVATGVVSADGARLVVPGGKVVASPDVPRLGVSWPGQARSVQLRAGRGPQRDDEIAISTALATAAGVRVGDRVAVLTLRPKQTFTLVGTFAYADPAQQVVAFTEPVAQTLMLGTSGAFSSIAVTARDGVTARQLRERITGTLGAGYRVRTAEQIVQAESATRGRSLGLTGNLLLGFAGVALFVGAFLILNTFSMLVAQRTRELALLRAIGAGRRQLVVSVLTEAAVVGLAGSVAGLAAGVGVGALAAGTSVVVPMSAVLAAFAVGLLVTMAAALPPAVRAARVLPVTALRDTAAPERPLTRLTVAGAVVLAVGAGLLGFGFAATASSAAPLILGGVLVAFIGVTMLTPALARPAAGLLGRVLGWSVPGRLARLNARRNPRRTAATAAALMVGVALLAGISTVFVSATASVGRLVADQVKADFVISGDANGSSRAGFDPAVLTAVAALPGVLAVSGLGESGAVIDGQPAYVETVTDVPALRDMLSLTAAAGTIGPLTDDQILVDQRAITATGPHVGDRVTVRLPRGEPRQFTLAGVYTDTDLINGWLLPASAAIGFKQALPSRAFVRLAPGADAGTARGQLTALLADSPEVGVNDRSEYTTQENAKADRILRIVQILLSLAVVIAVLGIANTVALSVLERTRELGLLRAVGLRRLQTLLMTAAEATVIAVFGALLGVTVGVGLGAATVRALQTQGVTELAVPVDQLLAYLGLAALVGAVAAIPPATRAARLNILTAIAHD
ncbi:FtsX-like permease family protein [Dactylosporangium sp. NPDC000244]|uniref:ABC transporter permease n=1 Tax=Dactylosporangium sp. NPDC000244 TaxID=3154365 RepID=UPI00331E271C